MGIMEQARTLVGAKASAPVWPPKRLSLALQGGGSFGAFTWGVLDRLLERGIAFDAISGASAGAVNAVLLASGLLEGRDEARARLASFWRRMSDSASFLPATSLATAMMGAGFSALTRAFSPYQFNPFDLNPLREALTAEVDFERLRAQSPVKLLVAATRVRDGQLRIFRNPELCVESVLASACLPLIHHTIEVEGEPYWDGGYVANPPLIPLVQASDAANLLIVQVTPAKSERLPTNPSEIVKRLDQIHFNATLNAELEALKVGLMLRATPKLRRLHIGRIAAQDEFEGLADENATNLGWDFLERLRDSGRNATDVWIAQTGA
ncbi:patatin-like phospholipase family protein [Methylocapsa sp. S129]|uniref:patatin-like phospholipase family protein n=1 Tax=Methylocapsa sp. S129 TaxID=1641869 RepID=UPI00131AE947|nr:patatin-like phospholipase family protein [Methylocapsa sp. S129]